MRKKASPVKRKARHDLSPKPKAVARKKATVPKPKKEKVPKTRNAGQLTESQYFSKIRSGLRNAFRWWVPMQIALKAASRPNQSANKRLKAEFQCAHCLEWFPRSMVEIDHKQACGSLRCLEDIAGFIERLTVEDPNAFQVLCKKDHKVKTLAEVAERKASK